MHTVAGMVTLHIEHGISDLATWRGAFDRFADMRRESGVLAHRISQPVDDGNYIVVDLDFAMAEQAQRFLGFLREKVWASPANAPALVGDPQTRILAVVNSST
jgi:hypothetical protein